MELFDDIYEGMKKTYVEYAENNPFNSKATVPTQPASAATPATPASPAVPAADPAADPAAAPAAAPAAPAAAPELPQQAQAFISTPQMQKFFTQNPDFLPIFTSLFQQTRAPAAPAAPPPSQNQPVDQPVVANG